MADEQVIKLLEEIRDLQKGAIKNQQESIDIQKRATPRNKIIIPAYILFLAALIGYLVWSSH